MTSNLSAAAPAGAGRSGALRLLRSRVALLFARNTAAGTIAFTLDMALLWALVHFGRMGALPSAVGGFVVAVSFHYYLSRIWVFAGSRRPVGQGYLYFALNAAIGLAVTMGLFAALMDFAGLHYLVARSMASVVAGILVFFLNAVLNFGSL
jgi:putative flippase GtrA